MKHLNKIAFALILMILAYIIVKELTVTKSKIGVIEMEKLVYEYAGMKDATSAYEKKLSGWNAQTDSLEQQLKEVYQQIELDSINGDKNKLVNDQRKFHYLQKSYYEFKQKTTKMAQEEDQVMTVGILNQLKEYTESYAKDEGYNLVINNTQMQNVGYVVEKNNITEQLLEYANKKYNGE